MSNQSIVTNRGTRLDSLFRFHLSDMSFDLHLSNNSIGGFYHYVELLLNVRSTKAVLLIQEYSK